MAVRATRAGHSRWPVTRQRSSAAERPARQSSCGTGNSGTPARNWFKRPHGRPLAWLGPAPHDEQLARAGGGDIAKAHFLGIQVEQLLLDLLVPLGGLRDHLVAPAVAVLLDAEPAAGAVRVALDPLGDMAPADRRTDPRGTRPWPRAPSPCAGSSRARRPIGQARAAATRCRRRPRRRSRAPAPLPQGWRRVPSPGVRGQRRAPDRPLRRHRGRRRQAPGSRCARACARPPQAEEARASSGDTDARTPARTRTGAVLSPGLETCPASQKMLNQPPACLNANSSRSLTPNSGPRSTPTSDTLSCGSLNARSNSASALTSRDSAKAPAPLTSIGICSASSAWT